MGVAFFGALFGASRGDVPRTGLEGLIFLVSPCANGGLLFPGVPGLLVGEPGAFLAGVCFPGLILGELVSTATVSILTELAGRDGVIFSGLLIPAVVFLGVTLLMGSSHTKWKPFSPTSSFCFVGDSLRLIGLFPPFVELLRFSLGGDRGGVAGDILTLWMKRR